MTSFRVFGEIIKTLYTDVNAANADSAYDIAKDRPQHKWSEVENDDTIEVTDVYVNDQSSNQ